MKLSSFLWFLICLGMLWVAVRIVAVIERMEKPVTQALEDFHAVSEQLPAFKQMGDGMTEAIKGFRVRMFAQENQAGAK